MTSITKRYVIGSVVNDSYRFAITPMVHIGFEAAEKEAGRLAQIHPDKEFHIFEFFASFKAVTRKIETVVGIKVTR